MGRSIWKPVRLEVPGVGWEEAGRQAGRLTGGPPFSSIPSGGEKHAIIDQ